ncbi:Glyoxalase/Bleomycin resistance protein/Dihydroxybiphenyl dioxygenase [Mytilinidion resinicola]|uniref:Glyoxalase/Bleomycin resistance protein/Dihydroxybiphenyl dioxygenase n=1 Tax=Mytilinidion resinicola TaxID=574789 RepID=A0A6A6YXD3_9PEZI|nr:Glyoxalase/Bleomycin resistance protein/Dihydroxybiphenyl dioxygenase [Mytilinidion resinicola]KAF2813612.1 Glyoxalase/Bleomycin resistance protein/Dihydroxybiphenyl dioxygenase [Mytilinidion resinicola]
MILPFSTLLSLLAAFSSLSTPALSCAPPQTRAQSPVTIGTDGPADPTTVGFNLNHIAIQVRNLTASRAFYGDVLGLRHIFTYEASADFAIVYMGHAQGGRNGTGYQTGAEMARDQWNSEGLLELVWSSENKHIDSAVFGFSHLGLIVPDIQAFQDRLIARNIQVEKKVGELPSKDFGVYFGLHGKDPVLPKALEELVAAFVFVRDPDGYLIEVQVQQ